ncbi:class I SAM-dependent methyltransferase [Mesorhizobium sp. Z1-4]|uniref:class I SAM-dependent methyltransferase n=1 Tax=Mesorhizobium sp. Z1-4 TaxID=2448478 RepID=UPI000FDA82B6|nr:class I SAM-dependent methyltransferase [Mesorhizobium sp. Z1-4]
MIATDEFWNRIARKYAANPIKDIAGYNRTIERTRSYLSGGDHVLEVGCGSGSTALLLATDVARITASDISSEMIAIGQEKAAAQGTSNVDFVCATPFDDAFPEAPYDAVLAFNFLHLTPDVTATLRRLAQLLRPGGLLISKTANIGGLRRFALQPLIGVMQLFGKAPSGLSFFTPKQLETMMRNSGFEIVASEFHGDSRPFIVARKK